MSDLSFLRYLHTGDQPAQAMEFSPDSQVLLLDSFTPGATPVHVDVDTGEAAEVLLDELGDMSWGGPCPSTARPRSSPWARATSSGSISATAGCSTRCRWRRRPWQAVLSPGGGRVAVDTLASTDGPGRVVILDTGTLDVVALVAEPGPPEDHFFTVPAWVGPDRLAVGSPSGRLLLWSPTAPRSHSC